MAATRKSFITQKAGVLFCILCYLLTLICQINLTEAVDCTIGGLDLTRLQSFNPWYADHKANSSFDIHLCKVASADHDSCSSGISVTGYNLTNKATQSYGNCTIFNHTTESDNSELLVMVKGSSCSNVPGELWTTIIYFKCGKKLGRPVYLGEFVCSVYFEWESFEFCKDLHHPANEIPCYVFNNSQLIDLSPLTKLKGGYLVNSENSRDIYINVCRDLTPDSASGTGSCPQNSSSCQIIQGTGSSMGQPMTKLQVQGSEIKMTYTSLTKPTECIDNPVTSIAFKCPERGGGKEPMLLRDFQCQIDIEWFTEYACPQEILTSDSCQLTKESHNIDIDLSPLMKHGSNYMVNATTGTDSYTYYLNVCDQLGIPCGQEHTSNEAVCQTKPNDPTAPGKNLGDAKHMTLRYSDGELSLIYENGDPCHTSFRRNTVINFQCQQDAGSGLPQFSEETDCTYVFDWKTQYACVNHPGDTACHVQHDGKLFDLSDLIIEQGNNWLVLSDREDGNKYYMNVCHDLLRVTETQNCPAGSAVCMKVNDGKSVNLGSFTKGLQYDPITQKLFINYTADSPQDFQCQHMISSIVTFICKPGDLESGPVLVHKSGDECEFQFEWHTAAACPMSHQHGKDCSVVDKQAGYSFDLRSLIKTNGDAYNVSVGEYDYFINVCSKIEGKHCKISPHDNAAVCQVRKDGSMEFKTGEPSQILEYFNGVLNLTYTNGEPYNGVQGSLRQTEIAFICDPKAGTGYPEFLAERNHSYSFKWLTAYACPSQPIECVAEDENGKQYDLSSLSKSVSGENWVVLDDSDPAKRRKFYINVCRNLAPIYGLASTGCDLSAAACETSLDEEKESVIIANLGQAKTRPKLKVARSHFVYLEYTDGSICPDGGVGARYNTTIHFMCVNGLQSRGPSPPRKVGPCSYEILWNTEAACALVEVDSDDNSTAETCSITYANYTYNLWSLRKNGSNFYSVQTPDKAHTFRLNICGAVVPPECSSVKGKAVSVCEVQSSGMTTGLAFAETLSLRFTKENNIMVTYTGQRDLSSGRQSEVQLELVCNREAKESANISFISQELNILLFRLETPATCAPQPVDCVVQDKQGRQFDLTPLARLTGNYVVPDSRPGHGDLQYFINVCRPINEIAGSTCPSGPIGGCQTGSGASVSLGYIQSKPVIADDDTISLRYTGGTVCHKGTPQEAARSMRINFFCSQVGGVPQFIGESANCEYSFTWGTPSACPQQRSEGSDCKVSDPLYNYEFNLIPLRKSESDYSVSVGEFIYLLNVCGGLNSPPPGCDSMGVCQTGNYLSSPVAAGKGNAKLIYDAGELSLVYEDGQGNCHGKYIRKSIITFVCDHSQSESGSGPQFLHELEDCTYTFVWSTSLACPPHALVDCTYMDSKTGKHYDLSQLALSNANYVKSYANTVTYIINICRSLVHRKGETCPFHSGACMINATETDLEKKYQSLGDVSENPLGMEDDKLVIRYNNGAACSKGNRMSTLIILSCDSTPEAVEGGPSSHFIRNDCEHGFVWNTPAACPLIPGQDTNTGTECKVTNPSTNYEFDLSKLRKQTGAYIVNDREGHQYFLNVCGAVSGTDCSNTSTGSCQKEIGGEKRSVNSGNANAKILYERNGVLTLNYSGGDVCHHNNVSRSTIINFICHIGAGDGVPTYVADSDGCLYYFHWHTELACEEQVQCEVSTGKETFDLTPLIKESGHHLAVPDLPAEKSQKSDARGTFYINVCRPLNPIFDTLCPAGAAACREVSGSTPQSLGQARSSPEYNPATKEVSLSYDHGQPCKNDPSVNASSHIIFHCKPGPDEGVPRLVDVSQSCEYVFQWETNVVCPDDTKEKETQNCTFFDQRTEYLFDLSPLREAKEVPGSHGGKIFIQACGKLSTSLSPLCGGAAVCLVDSRGVGSVSLQNGSYGSASSGVFQMDDEQLKLTFSDGQKCPHDDGKASTNIFFECDYEAHSGQPEAQAHFECQLNFKWKTSLICPPLREDCALSVGNTTLDLTILSQTKESWEFISSDHSRYWVNLCQGVHGVAQKQNCPPQSAVCRLSPNGQVDMLGDLRSQKISTEGDTVVIEYSEGSSACSHGRRRSNNPLARSVIRLMCGSTVGSPVLTASEETAESCLFNFTWNSRAACKKESIPQTLTDVNQVIQDSRSGGTINLRTLLHGSNNQVFDGQYTYIVSLDGHLNLDRSNPATSNCRGAAICQQLHSNATHQLNLGSYASRKYFLSEDQLEVEYTSPEKCASKKYSHKNITSIITFTCVSNKTQRSDPVFIYKTADCTYIFTWATPSACIQPKVKMAVATGNGNSADSINSGKAGGVNNTTLAAIVSIFFAILTLCLLAVYFHKPERRATTVSRLKRVVLCQRNTENHIRYSVLAQMEEDPEVDASLDTNPFEEEAENELQNGDTMGIRGYHDDSDDDMLL